MVLYSSLHIILRKKLKIKNLHGGFDLDILATHCCICKCSELHYFAAFIPWMYYLVVDSVWSLDYLVGYLSVG